MTTRINIDTEALSPRRELAHRRSGGLDITLYWSPADDSTSVEVHQGTTGETIAFPVTREAALQAFHHPFAHLGSLTAEDPLGIEVEAAEVHYLETLFDWI